MSAAGVAALPDKADTWTRAAVARLLPASWTAVVTPSFAGRPGPAVRATSGPVLGPLAVGISPDDPTSAVRWLHELDEAERVGMVISVPLGANTRATDFTVVVYGLPSDTGLDDELAQQGGTDNGNLGPVDLSVAPLPPHGIAIAVSGELVSGGGSIDRTAPGTYLGGIALRVAAFQVSAAALLESMPDGYSFACVLGATFPSIPLFAGFTLDGIGGALMLHRTIGEDALRAKLRTGTSFLFPDPKEIAASARELHDLFPARRGRHVLGPAVRLGWGSPSMVQADLAVLVEVPLPIKVALIGAIEVGLPSLEQRIVNLRIDLLGVVDFGRRTIAFDASLHDSTIAGYELGGDAAMRLRWGDDPTFLVAMGGFHPRFQPPADLPALRRLALDGLPAFQDPRTRRSAWSDRPRS